MSDIHEKDKETNDLEKELNDLQNKKDKTDKKISLLKSNLNMVIVTK